MHQTIRTTLLLSSTALFSAACTNMPVEGQDTAYNAGGYSASSAPINQVPEAGPLSANTAAPAAATHNVAMAANVPPAAAPQNIPVATVPQVPVPVANYTPAANTNNVSAYDTYAAAPAQTTPTYSNVATNNVVDYSQPQNTANGGYNSYGAANTTAATNPAVTNYYPGNASYDSYANSGSATMVNNGASGNYSNAAATGSSAVQVFASGSQAKAEQISQNMRSQGLPAIVDAVNGLYKVRIPYPDAGTARANLMRVRQASGEAGAFITTR